MKRMNIHNVITPPIIKQKRKRINNENIKIMYNIILRKPNPSSVELVVEIY